MHSDKDIWEIDPQNKILESITTFLLFPYLATWIFEFPNIFKHKHLSESQNRFINTVYEREQFLLLHYYLVKYVSIPTN